jgi:hypothetical protein
MLNGKLDGVILQFDRTNWFIPQFISVSAPLDDLAEGARVLNIQHSVQQGGSPDDGGEYDKLTLPTIVAEVIDADTAGVVVAPARGGALVSEAGTFASSSEYQVVLTQQPQADVKVMIGHDSQVELDKSTLISRRTIGIGPSADGYHHREAGQWV